MTAHFRAPNVFIVPNKRMCGDFQNKIEPPKQRLVLINKSLQRFPVPQTSNWSENILGSTVFSSGSRY